MVKPLPGYDAQSLTKARRLEALLGSLCAALLFAVAFLLWKPIGGDPIGGQVALDDPRVREAVVAQLLGDNPAIFDSHPDPAVARVLAPNIKTRQQNVTIESNAWGMREREYELPKPPGLLRVVLLGDSFVFGHGVEAEDRFGVFLQQELERRHGPGFTGKIEVIHIGIGSWNIVAECTFVRRQLTELDPDLVIQVIVANDLDDNAGVRGFGVRSDFDPYVAERANSRVHWQYPVHELESEDANYLMRGLDHESAGRMQQAADHIHGLVRELDRRGTPYQLLFNMQVPAIHAFLPYVEDLGTERIAYVDVLTMDDKRYRVSATNPHWSRNGHERIARLLYALIRSRNLLPALELEDWPEATREVEELYAVVVGRLAGYFHGPPKVATRLKGPTQIYGGIDLDGAVSPYASVVLGPGTEGRLVLTGRCYDRPELDGATVEVFVEDRSVGTFELQAGKALELEWPLPGDLAAREHVAVRFACSDWIYTGPERRDCKSFVLDKLELE